MARTVLPLYGSTLSPASTTASAPAASALRSTVPALPGSRMSARTATSRGRAGQRGRQRHVERRADRDDALRGGGLGQRGRGPVGDRGDRYAGSVRALDQVGVPVGGGVGDEQLARRRVVRERLPDGLRPLGQELPGRVPAGPPGQLPGRDDPRRPLGEHLVTAALDAARPSPGGGPGVRWHGRPGRATPRRPRRAGAASEVCRKLRRRTRRPAAPPARCAPARRTRSGRSPPGRPAPCGRPRRPAALSPCTKRLYVMPFARAAALIRVIHSWRKSPLRARRSRKA